MKKQSVIKFNIFYLGLCKCVMSGYFFSDSAHPDQWVLFIVSFYEIIQVFCIATNTLVIPSITHAKSTGVYITDD